MSAGSWSSVAEIWRFVLSRRLKEIIFVVFLILVSACAEILSIGAVIPFLSLVSNSNVALENQFVGEIAQLFSLENGKEITVYITIIFCTAVLIAGFLRVYLLKVITSVAHLAGSDLSIYTYEQIMARPYEEQILTNSNDLIGSVTTKINNTISVIYSLISLVGGTFVFLALGMVIVYIDYQVALVSVLVFGGGYVIVARYTRRRLLENSKVISSNTSCLVKVLQESLGGIRDVILDGLQNYFVSQYKTVDQPLRVAMGDNLFRGGSPRYIMETVGIVLISSIALYFSMSLDDPSKAIPMLGAIALAAQRMLPVMQQLYQGWANIMGHRIEVEEIASICRSVKIRRLSGSDAVSFDRTLILKDVSYAYAKDKTKSVLNKINLQINKGEKIGFIGKTGYGKSTLVDVIMGLLVNIDGELRVDDILIDEGNIGAWRARIAHVPQEIFLKNDTVIANIGFADKCPDYDYSKVENVLEKAQLSEFIEGVPEGVDYIVGERGVNLSGGQKQRVGIARALYKNADLIVLDEATSALDIKTEQEIVKMIGEFDKDLTVIIIAHRLSTLLNCDRVFELNEKGLNQVDIRNIIEKNDHNKQN